MKATLTDRQKTFVEKLIKCGSKTQAYKEAGYSCKKTNTACREANKLLNNPRVAAYYQKLLDEKHSNNIADAEEVLRFYTSVMRGEIKDAFNLDPTLADRLKAADALAKRYQLFTQKLEVEGAQKTVVQFVEDLVDD